MTKPNFLYIGPDKAGSSWLHEVLITHPQIFMPEAKDLYFFDRYYDKGLDWYLRHFDGATAQHTIVGEVTQDYLADERCPARIQESLGQVRTMVTLRDPADRAFSSYLYMLKHGENEGTFVEALDRRPELIEHGRYGAALLRYKERFGVESIFIADFADLGSDPQAFIDRLLEWLGVEPMTLGELADVRLPASKARNAGLARLVRIAAHLVRERNGANLVGRIKRNPAVHKVLYKPLGDDKPVMTDAERKAVQERLADDVALLDDEFGLDFATRWGWSTDSATQTADR
ncbi:MAG: sulfotransferase domain-containing protein [Actinomycetales bacterium]